MNSWWVLTTRSDGSPDTHFQESGRECIHVINGRVKPLGSRCLRGLFCFAYVRMMRPPRQLLEISQKPAAALSSSLLNENSWGLHERRALSSPTNRTRFVSWGLGSRLNGFQTLSSANKTAVPEWVISPDWKDQMLCRSWLGLLDDKGGIPLPLVRSQTSGRGTADAGDARTSRSNSALIPLHYSQGIECIVFRALLPRNECHLLHHAFFNCWRYSLLVH